MLERAAVSCTHTSAETQLTGNSFLARLKCLAMHVAEDDCAGRLPILCKKSVDGYRGVSPVGSLGLEYLFFFQTFPHNGHAPGIYPDQLHILDLTIYNDIISSTMIALTDNDKIFAGNGRDERLLELWKLYAKWCKDS